MLPQQCTPSPVGEGASLKLPSDLHSHAAAVRQDVQMSSYTHPDRKEAGAQHSSDQLMTRQSSSKLQKIHSHGYRIVIYSSSYCVAVLSPIKPVIILYVCLPTSLCLPYFPNFYSSHLHFTQSGYTHRATC